MGRTEAWCIVLSKCECSLGVIRPLLVSVFLSLAERMFLLQC